MLHVLEVEANSPAELAGLVPFKDYLLGTAEKVTASFYLSCYNYIYIPYCEISYLVLLVVSQ